MLLVSTLSYSMPESLGQSIAIEIHRQSTGSLYIVESGVVLLESDFPLKTSNICRDCCHAFLETCCFVPEEKLRARAR